MEKTLNFRSISKKILLKIKKEISPIKNKSIAYFTSNPKNPFCRQLEKKCKILNIKLKKIDISKKNSEEIIKKIKDFNNNEKIQGISMEVFLKSILYLKI